MPNEQHRHVRRPQQRLGDTAEQHTPHAVPTLRAHHDEIGFAFLRGAGNYLRYAIAVSVDRPRHTRYALLAQ
jgi:hypothetical protein